MNKSKTFEAFCSSINLESTSDFDTSISGITKKLNKKYYDIVSETENRYIVGSIGRHTAVKGVSDVDLIFDLPDSVYKKFDKYESNGQSALLQEIRDALRETYPKTKIIGDGQVVSIAFNKYTIELVPGFKQTDDNFRYPDTHYGGSWKITKPIPEQNASIEADNNSNGNFVSLCNVLRAWKNNVGFKFGGLLIDTLVCDFLESNELYNSASYSEFDETIKCLFEHLKNQDSERTYWLALGSNQQIKDGSNGKFIKKAKKAYNKINNAKNDSELEKAFSDLFGKIFDDNIVDSTSRKNIIEMSSSYNYYTNEKFIENMFEVDILYDLSIDCTVTQNGFRPFKLMDWIFNGKYLSINKTLEFALVSTNARQPYEIYWKVRNCGREAYRLKMARGEITKDNGSGKKVEHTSFNGEHFVECYLVEDNICVARARISVPINESISDIENKL